MNRDYSNRPSWDDQFAETVEERNKRLRAKRLKYDKERRTIVDPRDPDHTRIGMFVLHNCWKCKNGTEACIVGNPRQCEFPHARND